MTTDNQHEEIHNQRD